MAKWNEKLIPVSYLLRKIGLPYMVKTAPEKWPNPRVK